MFSWLKQKKKIKKALQNQSLQQALDKASWHHFQKFAAITKEIPWTEYKKRAQAIKKECLSKLPQLIQQFSRQAQQSGATVYQVSTPSQALSIIEKILLQKKAKLIVKSKSMVTEEINLRGYLQEKGFQVVETDLGEWIIQLSGERPSHLTAPALHKTKEEIASLLSHHLHQKIPADSQLLVKAVRQEMRNFFIEADVGISGANLAVAESGTLVIISNEGNARLVTSLPPVHIALLTVEKFVETLEQAVSLIKTLTVASSGLKLTSYISFITGPSRTSDIEKELIIGAHGPQEVHIIILDNGRLKTREDSDLQQILPCLKCGGCMLICPVFQAVGGHIFGGPIYPGGIGVLLTAITKSRKEASRLFDFCSDCRKCEEFCPVSIPTSQLILKLKSEKGPNLIEKSLSSFFSRKTLSQLLTKFIYHIQKPWQENGYLKNLPLPIASKKLMPAFKLKKHSSPTNQQGEKVYFFEGCLTRFFFPEIRESVGCGLAHFGYNVISPLEQGCCGAPCFHLGDIKATKKLARANIESWQKENPTYIITICPTGYSMLTKIYPQLYPEFSSWTARERIEEAKAS
ncbi:MAG: LUD domain-containing protein, partial [Candidatus Aminicenantales bacterium]